MKPRSLLITVVLILAASACASPTPIATPTLQPLPTVTQTRKSTVAVTPIRTATISPTPETNEHYIYSADWSPNGARIAMHVFNGIEIYDSDSLELVTTIKTTIQSYVFTQDSKGLITSGNNDSIEIWEIESGKLIQTIQGNSNIGNFALSPSGELLGVSEKIRDCKCIQLINFKTGKLIGTFKEPDLKYTSEPSEIKFFQDNTTFLAWQRSTGVQVWQINNNQIRLLFSNNGRSNNDNGKWVVSASIASKANLFAILFNPIPGAGDHTPLETRTLTPSPQPEIPEIVIHDLNKQAQRNLQQLNSLLRNTSNSFESYIRKLQFSQDEKILILSSYGQVFFWDFSNDEFIRKIEIDGFESIYNYNGTQAIVVRSKNNRHDTIEMWDTMTGKIIKTKTR